MTYWREFTVCRFVLAIVSYATLYIPSTRYVEVDYLRIATGVLYCENYVVEVIYDSNFLPEFSVQNTPDNKVHGVNMGPIWGRQGPGGPHVRVVSFAIWDALHSPMIIVIWKKILIQKSFPTYNCTINIGITTWMVKGTYRYNRQNN